MGSGSATHNLRELGVFGHLEEPPAYVQEFEQWLADTVTQGRKQDLVDYLEKGPHSRRAHPTNDHFYPLLVAAGAGDDGVGELLHHSVTFGILAMDAFAYA